MSGSSSEDDIHNSEQHEREIQLKNLSTEVDRPMLYELFLQAGPVESVWTGMTLSGLAKNAVITFHHIASVSYAIELFRGTSLFGIELEMKPGVKFIPPSHDEESTDSDKSVSDIMDSSVMYRSTQ